LLVKQPIYEMIHNSAGAKPLNQIANIKNNIIPRHWYKSVANNERENKTHAGMLFALGGDNFALASPQATK